MDLKLFFSGFIQLYYYWETLVIISIFAVVMNSFYALVSKKIFTFFDLRITIFTLVFNHLFFIIGFFIYLFNLVLFFLFKEKEYTEEDALTNARLARILTVDDYDFNKKEPKLWTPSSDYRVDDGSGWQLRLAVGSTA